MNIGRTLTITRRVFRGLKSDWRLVLMVFLAPVLAITIFGVAYSGDINSVQVVVVNLDEGYTIPPSTVPVSIADAIVANLDGDLMILKEVPTEQEGEDIVRAGDAYGMIVFPEHFTSNVYEKQIDPDSSVDTAIQLEMDRSNVTVANTILKAVGDAMMKTSSSMGVEPAVTLDTSEAVYAQDANFRDFSVPGITVFVVFILTFTLTLLSFVGERTTGSLARLYASPMKETELVAGYALAFSLIAMVQTAMVLAVVVGVFQVMLVGSAFLTFLVIALLAIFSLSLGILLSSLATSESQALQFMPLMATPVFLLGGVFWPVEAIPAWMRWLCYAVPPTYAVDAMRAVMLRGWGIGQIWVQVVALTGFAVACLGGSVLLLRRERGQ